MSMIPTPPPSSNVSRKNQKLHESTSNVDDEVFQRMLNRMAQSSNTNNNNNASSFNNNKKAASSSARLTAGKKSWRNNNSSNNPSSSVRGNNNTNNDHHASSIEDLPGIISSLRGALGPRGGGRDRMDSSASNMLVGNTSLADRESLEKELLRGRYRSRSIVESPHMATGQGKLFLKYEKSREQEKQVDEAKAARGTFAHSKMNQQDLNDPNGILSDNNNDQYDKKNRTKTSSNNTFDHESLVNRSNMSKAVTANIRLQQQQQGENNNNNGSNNDDDEARKADVGEIENRIFGGGPVPPSLRSVVDEVRSQVAQKLKLSDVGTFHNCVQSLFECRSLIDQVLKQMPNHWHFRDEQFGLSPEEENVALMNHQQRQIQRRQSKIIQQAAQQKLLSEMMEDCRKTAQQVSIPQGGYTLDQESGKVNVGITGSATLYEIQTQQHKQMNNNNNNNNNNQSQRPSVAFMNNSTRSSVTDGNNNFVFSSMMNNNNISSPLPAYADFAGRSLKDQHTVYSHSSAVEQGTLANALKLLDPDSDNQHLLRHLRKQTQQTTSATQTDEKIKDELTKEDFAFQQRKCDELEVLVKEYEGTVGRLRNQLRIAQGALATRSGTVTYIRETLLKESSILKTQLQVLQQHQLHQQQLTLSTSPSSGTLNNPSSQTLVGSVSSIGLYTNNNNLMNQQQSPNRRMSFGSGHNNNSSFASPNNNNTNASQHTLLNVSNGTFHQQQRMATPLAGTNNSLPSFARPISGMGNTNYNENSTSYGGAYQHSQQNVLEGTTTMNNQHQNNYNNTNNDHQQNQQPQQQTRPPPFSTLALQPLAPIYSLLDTILCAVENEEVLERENPTGNNSYHDLLHQHETSSSATSAETTTFNTGPSKEAQLRELKGLFAQQQAHWKRETADARSRFSLTMKRKNEQLKKLALASNVNYLRETLLKMFGDFKDSFSDFKTSVKTAMKMHSNFISRASKDLEFGIQKASTELEDHQLLVKERNALKGVIFALPDLMVPSLAPEFAMGYHSWSFADSNEPLKAFSSSHFGPEITDRMADELGCLHELFVEVQRFGVRVHQLPDVHRPKPGWLLSRVAQGLLRSPSCTNELAMQIRTHLERDDALAKQQAKVNIAIHGVIIRRKVLADRIRAALREGEVEGHQNLSDEATLSDLTSVSPWDRSNKVSNSRRLAAINATFSDIPTCATRFNQFSEDIDTAHIKRMKLQQQRMENSRQLFQLWRNSGIDVTGGRYAIVARDPDSQWTSGLVKTRRLKGPGGANNNNNNQYDQSSTSMNSSWTNSTTTMMGRSRNNSSNSTAMGMSGRYGNSTGVTSSTALMMKSQRQNAAQQQQNNNSPSSSQQQNDEDGSSQQQPLSPRKRLVSVYAIDEEEN